MSENTELLINDSWIVSLRGNKNPVDPQKPYGWLVEKERTVSGKIEDTGIIFLTNRECPFHCLMCDLWKNTTNETAASGSIPHQIEYALSKMPEVKHVKLYNSGSFFDIRAIPEDDYRDIASLLREFETVIVESHPKLISDRCLFFRDMLTPELHIAMGLETVHPEILRRLNKNMTPDDFNRSVRFLAKHNIQTRAFILLRPPFLSEDEGIFWAERSIDFAFSSGVECCTVIPVRAGNGAMDKLEEEGYFKMPSVHSLESVVEYGINLKSGRVFADLWDLNQFSTCNECLERRINRILEMNLYQIIPSPLNCTCIET
jgi:archaeosine synthase beta-subunit